MKIIVTIIPANSVTSSLSYLSCLFIESKTRIEFSASWWSGNEK